MKYLNNKEQFLAKIQDCVRKKETQMISGDLPINQSTNIIALCLAIDLISKGPKDEFVVICDGIIQNNKEIQKELMKRFKSRWDSEKVITTAV